MTPRPHLAEEGLLSWIERWAPTEAEIWGRWRRSLSSGQREAALLPLQAALAGLAAFRHLENHPPAAAVIDFRPHLHAMRVTCAWALGLARELGADHPPERGLRPVGATTIEPSASLDALGRSLGDALRVSERLLDLPSVDSDAFAASCDLFLRDLSRNAYFRPSDPLEFANVTELIGPERFPAHLASWRHDAAKTTTIVAFLSLLRSHRYLGIADHQMSEDEGIYRAHVVLAGTRRELRTLTRFLMVQGEEVVEPLAMEVHDAVRAGLADPLPTLGGAQSLAAPSERLRNGIRQVRGTVKEAAKRLRDLAAPPEPERVERSSERVQKNLQQDIWAFRFILRGFIAKASAHRPGGHGAKGAEGLGFACEFARHFRAFGPRLAKGTDYPQRGPLIRAVSALSRRSEIDEESLGRAAQECARFVEHLDQALEGVDSQVSFDKRRAAAELRGYLEGARDRFSSGPPPTGTFGLGDEDQAEAG